jgi:hypothetical protein
MGMRLAMPAVKSFLKGWRIIDSLPLSKLSDIPYKFVISSVYQHQPDASKN